MRYGIIVTWKTGEQTVNVFRTTEEATAAYIPVKDLIENIKVLDIKSRTEYSLF